MTLSKERKNGAILSYISIAINTLIQLLYTPLLIRKLGQSEYGLYSLVASIIGYLTIMDLGFGNAIIVFTAKYRAKGQKEDEQKLHGMFNIIFKIIGVIATILGIVLYFNVENFFGKTMTIIELNKMKTMMIILSFNLFLSFYFAIYNSIISAYEKFTFQKIVAIIHTLLKTLIMLPLLFMGFKSIALCVTVTILNVLLSIANYIYCSKIMKINVHFQGFDKKIFKTIFNYSIWIVLGIIVDKVNWSVDNFVLGSVSGTIEISIYSIASTLNQLFISLSTAISGVLLPKMSKMIAKKASNEELTEEFIKIGRIQYYIIFLMCSGLVLFGKQFIMLWAGVEYTRSYYVALLLIIPLCIPLIQNLGLSIMQAMNRYKFKSISTAIMSIINIAISIYFSKMWGAIGAALGTGISLIICNIIIINIYYYKEIKLNVIKFWKSILKQTIPFIIPITIIIIVMKLTNFSGVRAFILYGSLYTLIYCIVAYCLSMNKYEKELINKMIIKLNLRREKI